MFLFQIDEPKTPYHLYSDSEEDAMSQRSDRPRRVSLVGSAVDAEELAKGLSAAATTSGSSTEHLKKYEPGADDDEEEIDESMMTQEQLCKWL